MTKRLCQHPRIVVAQGIILAAVGLWLTVTQLGYISNTMDLIREDAEFRKVYAKYVEAFDIVPELVVVATGEREVNRRALAWIEKQLRKSSLFERIDWKLDFERLKQKSLLLAPKDELRKASEDIKTLSDNLSDLPLNWLGVLQATVRGLQSEQQQDLDTWLAQKEQLEDLLNNLSNYALTLEKGQLIMPEREDFLSAVKSSWEEHEYFEFDDGRMAVMLIRPAPGDPSAISPWHEAISKIRTTLRDAAREFPQVSFGLTGEPVLDADQVETSISSVARASVIALFLIIVLFLLSYREATRPLLAVATLLIGTFWTFGFATLAIGHLNIISNAFVAMVLGLGIDFGIQIIGRYEESISRGSKVLDALCESVSKTGSAIFVGAITTTAAFFTMCFNDFSGLAELGIIAGTGVALCLVANLTILPAMIWLADNNRKNLDQSALATHWKGGLLLKEPFKNKPVIPVALGGILTLLMGLVAWTKSSVSFDYNLLNLQNPKLDSVRVEKELIKHGQQTINYAVVLADDLKNAHTIAENLRMLPSVAQVVSAADFMPLDQDQRILIVNNILSKTEALILDDLLAEDIPRILLSLRNMTTLAETASREARAFAALSDDAREAAQLLDQLRKLSSHTAELLERNDSTETTKLSLAWDQALFGPARRAITWLKTQKTEPVTEQDIPVLLRQRLISKNGYFAVEIYPRENVWERQQAEVFINEIRQISPDVTGTPVMNLEYLRMLREAFVSAGTLAVCVILVVMFIHFRNISLTLLSVVPLGLAVIWTLGIMPLFNLRFNPANIITLPLTVGIGVAYGIYVVDRLRENSATSLFDTSTGKSVWLSALTTIIGFGSLIQSSYRGISGLGLLMTISVAMCLISSLYILPALLRLGKLSPPPDYGETKT